MLVVVGGARGEAHGDPGSGWRSCSKSMMYNICTVVRPKWSVELIIQVDQPIKYLGFDIAAGGIGAQDGVQDLRIAEGALDILAQSLGIALALLVVGGNPEKRLEQNEHNDKRKKQ